MASRAFGIVLLLALVAFALVSFGLLMVQWVRSANEPTPTIPPKTGIILYYEAPVSAQLVFHTLPGLAN